MKIACILLGILFLILSCSTSKKERRNREENRLLWERCNNLFDSLEREITDLRYLNDSLIISNIDFKKDMEINLETGMRQTEEESRGESEEDQVVYQEIIMAGQISFLLSKNEGSRSKK